MGSVVGKDGTGISPEQIALSRVASIRYELLVLFEASDATQTKDIFDGQITLVKVSRCARIVRATKLGFLTAGKSFQRRVMAGSNKRRQPFSGYNW